MKKLFAELLKDDRSRRDLIEMLAWLNQEGLETWASEQLTRAIWDDPDLAQAAAQRLQLELSETAPEASPQTPATVDVSATNEADTNLFTEAAADLNRALAEDKPRRGSLQLRYQRISYLKLIQRHDPMGFLELRELHSQGPLARSIVEGLSQWEAQQRGTLNAVRDLLHECGVSR
ncbi:MAG: hypothetical protein KIT87_24175 [Anaerolineae bacterium]|nr:hypothetical protein [Anaerolineae bacterium]